MGVFQKRFSASWECQTPLPYKRVRESPDSDRDSDNMSSYPEEVRKQYVLETFCVHTPIHTCIHPRMHTYIQWLKL